MGKHEWYKDTSFYSLLTESAIETKKFVYYQEDEMFIGWLEELPDYRTQGYSLEELKENLLDIYQDLTNGAIPSVRKVGELVVS